MASLSTALPARASYARRVLICCALVAFLDGFDTQAIAPAAPAIARQLGVAPAAMGPTFAASQIGFLIGAFLFGALGDRHGRKRMLLVCTGLFTLGTLGTALAGSMPILLACRLLAGLGLGGASPNFVSLASEFAAPERRARVVTMLWAAVPLGGMAGAFTSGLLLPRAGWHAVFLLGASAPLPVLVAILAFVPESREVSPAAHTGVATLFTPGTRSRTLLLWAASFMTWTTLVVTALWMPTLLQRAGWGSAQAAGMLALNNGGGVIGTLVVGALIGRGGAGHALRLTLAGAAAAILLMAVTPGMPPLFALLAAIAGFAASAAGGSMLALSSAAYDPQVRSTGVGWALGVGRIGTVLGPIAIGILLGMGIVPGAAFAILAGIALLGVVTSFFLVRAMRANPNQKGD